MKKFLSLLLMTVMAVTAWANVSTITFVQDSKTSGTLTGAPNGVSYTFVNTGSNANDQLTAGNSMTLTLTGFSSNATLKGVTLELRNNASKGDGSATVSVGGNQVGSIDAITGLGATYAEHAVEITETQLTGDLVIHIAATANSVWCDKFIITIDDGNGGDTPTPTTYNVNIAQMTNGSVTANPTSAAENATVTLTVSPNAGYELDEIAVAYGATNVALTTVTEGAEYTFSMPASDVLVTASFVGDGSFYTLDGTQTGGSSGYATESEITQNSMTWMVTGNTTISPWRIGGKSLNGVDREVYSTTSMPKAISKVSLVLGDATATVNSIKLTVASDAAFSTVLDELTATFAANSTIDFTPSTGSAWATGAYYKFTFNVNAGSSGNQYVQFVGAKFYEGEGGDTPVTVDVPTFDPAAGEVAYNTTVGGELKTYSDLMDEGMELALARLREKAEAAGADGVYGVRVATPQVTGGAAEIIVYGTAYRFIEGVR